MHDPPRVRPLHRPNVKGRAASAQPEAGFLDCFVETARRLVGGGPKTTPATQLEWRGHLAGVAMRLRSTVRLREPSEHFLTPSNMRLRHSHVGRSGHFVDIEVLDASASLTPELLRQIERMAAAVDDRPILVRPAGSRLFRP